MAAATALEAVAPTGALWGLVQDFVMGQQEGPADQVAAGTADGAARLPLGGLQEGAASARAPGGKGAVTLRDWSRAGCEHRVLKNHNKLRVACSLP